MGKPPAYVSTSGTLILSVITDHGAYLAADSRGTNPRNDTAQKIFQCGPEGFIALTGRLIQRAEVRSAENRTMQSGMLNLMEVMREFSTGYAGDGRALADRIGRRVYRVLKPFWELFVEPNPKSFLDANTEPGTATFCEIPILTRSAGSLERWVVSFPFTASGELNAPAKQGPYNRANHYKTWGQNVDLDAIDLQVHSREAVLATIAAIYTRASSVHPDTIGGPTDIGFMDVDGMDWLARKNPG